RMDAPPLPGVVLLGRPRPRRRVLVLHRRRRRCARQPRRRREALMAFYVTIRDSSVRRTVFAAGPFARHGDAERCVGHVRRYVHEHYPNDAAWAGWGTSRVKSGPMPAGRFNEQLGLPAGRITSLPLV